MSDNKQITVTSPLLPPLEEFIPYLQQIWDSKWITNNGHFHQQLEQALAEYLGVEYISVFTNGTLPLITALQALGLTKGEVITTPYSFVATTHAIWWNQLTPVFVDVDPVTGCIDPDKIEAAITENTVAIMPVHVYGTPCDTERIDAIAKAHGLKVIYDAAHAFAVKAPSNSPEGGEFEEDLVDVRGWQTADPVTYELLKQKAKEMRAKPTHAEDAMWQLLRMNKLGEHFRRQHIIGDYIVDFVCLDKRLIIEIDGGYHFTSEQVQDDAIREAALKRYGFTILRFTNNQVLVEYENVLKCIQNTLASLPSRGRRRGLESILKAGDISTLSFHATKTYNTVEGGALICHSAEMKQQIDYLKNFGFEDETVVVGPGINSKMDEIRAAYGLLNLKHVDNAIAARKRVAEQYVVALKDVAGITLYQPIVDSFNFKHSTLNIQLNYSYFPIFVDAAIYGMTRDELYEKMRANNVLGRRYFYPLISTFSPYNVYPSAAKENLPNAHRMADSVICLPMHHALSEEDIKRVIDCLTN